MAKFSKTFMADAIGTAPNKRTLEQKRAVEHAMALMYQANENPGIYSAYCLGKRAAGENLDNPFSRADYQEAWERGKRMAESLN